MRATRAMVVAKKRSPARMLAILMMSSRFCGATVCANSANFFSVGTGIACWLDGLEDRMSVSVEVLRESQIQIGRRTTQNQIGYVQNWGVIWDVKPQGVDAALVHRLSQPPTP